jgi:hypothetical protein
MIGSRVLITSSKVGDSIEMVLSRDYKYLERKYEKSLDDKAYITQQNQVLNREVMLLERGLNERNGEMHVLRERVQEYSFLQERLQQAQTNAINAALLVQDLRKDQNISADTWYNTVKSLQKELEKGRNELEAEKNRRKLTERDVGEFCPRSGS